MKNVVLSKIAFAALMFFQLGCGPTHAQKEVKIAHYAQQSPDLDGAADEACWKLGKWHTIDQVWLGDVPTESDFSGRFKVCWNEKRLYLLVEVTDDVLSDRHRGTNAYWDDDCVEVFVDEDRSGGNHQTSHQAFAYHVGLDGKVIDLDKNNNPIYFNDHVESVYRTENGKTTWELSLLVFDKHFKENRKNQPVTLTADKEIGFAVAYCDNDGNEHRDSFIGSEVITGEDKNRGWIDAGVFGHFVLKK